MNEVIVYSGENCAYCIKMKNYLTGKNIAYTERSITVEKFRDELLAMKYRSVPVLIYGDEVIVGFSKEKLDELFK